MYPHIWNDQILNFQNSLSSITTLLPMYSKICLWKCTRYTDRLTETGDNFIEGNLCLCTVYTCIQEQNLFYDSMILLPAFSPGFLNIFSV